MKDSEQPEERRGEAQGFAEFEEKMLNKIYKLQSGRLFMPKVIHEKDKCIGCGACVAVCPDFWKWRRRQVCSQGRQEGRKKL